MAENIYRIDDVLIRVGFVLGIIALFTVYALPGFSAPWPSRLAYVAVPFLLVAPLCLLITGYAVRRRERRLLEIWRLLKEHGEIPVGDLRHMSGYSRKELRDAVSLLNRKLAAGLSWDEGSDTIRHARLGQRETLTHSQRCGSCGAAVSVKVSARSQAEELHCSYCKGSLDGEAISGLQNKLLAREARYRNPEPVPTFFSAAAEAPMPPVKRFSIVFFVVLLVFFWPAALIYAIHHANSSRTFS